ncbi:hypothetical protein [Desertivirga brevis]|uniref:hypothetical protein n=1 Tax=Desertivirga brevis TaxID=2810310 RepID=UPI001A97CE6B|nr:hypothetical protein [Pedobacter sp. SYSU D00873]
MDVEVKVWLYDILNEINEIESFFVVTPMEFQQYQSDLSLRICPYIHPIIANVN